MKSCPVCNRTYFDNTFSFCLEDGALLSAPFENEVQTVMRSKPVGHSGIPSNEHLTEFNDPIIAINIAQLFPHVRTEEDMYTATRGLWRVSKSRAEKAKYAFAVFKGVIREVYVIDRWEPADIVSRSLWEEKLHSEGIVTKPSVNEGRFQFVGRLAEGRIRGKYVGTQMPFPHGQNPIRYLNC